MTATGPAGIGCTALVLLSITACAADTGQAPAAVSALRQGVSYGENGVYSVLPVDGERSIALGFLIRNAGSRDIVVTDAAPILVSGARVEQTAVLDGAPREQAEIASSVPYPPVDGAEGLRSLGKGFSLTAGRRSAMWGANVLFHIRVEQPHALVRDYEVQGTIDGSPFRDVVDVRTVICTDGEDVSHACREFAASSGVDVGDP